MGLKMQSSEVVAQSSWVFNARAALIRDAEWKKALLHMQRLSRPDVQ